jgi:hypothetical protein
VSTTRFVAGRQLFKVNTTSIKWEVTLTFLSPKIRSSFVNFKRYYSPFWSKQLAFLHTREVPCLSQEVNTEARLWFSGIGHIRFRWTLASFFALFYPGAVSFQIYEHIWNYMALQPERLILILSHYDNLKSSVTSFMVFLFPWMNAMILMLYNRPHMLSTHLSQLPIHNHSLI